MTICAASGTLTQRSEIYPRRTDIRLAPSSPYSIYAKENYNESYHGVCRWNHLGEVILNRYSMNNITPKH